MAEREARVLEQHADPVLRAEDVRGVNPDVARRDGGQLEAFDALCVEQHLECQLVRPRLGRRELDGERLKRRQARELAQCDLRGRRCDDRDAGERDVVVGLGWVGRSRRRVAAGP